VDLEVWYTSSDDRAMFFLKRLGSLLNRLNGKVNFKPRSVSYPCPQCDTDFKKKNCFGQGKYCAYEKSASIVPGKDVLAEDIL